MKRFMYLLVVVAFLAAVFLAVPAGAMAAQLEPAEDGGLEINPTIIEKDKDFNCICLPLDRNSLR